MITSNTVLRRKNSLVVRALITAGLLACSGISLVGRTLTAEIPFDFSVGSRAMKAGAYRVVATPDNNTVVFEHVASGAAAIRVERPHMQAMSNGMALEFVCKKDVCKYRALVPATKNNTQDGRKRILVTQ